MWNHDGTRYNGVSHFVEPGQIAVPFQSTFDFRFAFIDFGFSVRFGPDDADHIVESQHCPPDEFASPEQRRGGKYDIFASDVYNLGRFLEHELEEATRVGDFLLILVVLSQIYVKTISGGNPRGNRGSSCLHRTLGSHDKRRTFEAPDIAQRTGIRACLH